MTVSIRSELSFGRFTTAAANPNPHSRWALVELPHSFRFSRSLMRYICLEGGERPVEGAESNKRQRLPVFTSARPKLRSQKLEYYYQDKKQNHVYATFLITFLFRLFQLMSDRTQSGTASGNAPSFQTSPPSHKDPHLLLLLLLFCFRSELRLFCSFRQFRSRFIPYFFFSPS